MTSTVDKSELPPDKTDVNRQLTALYISTFLLRIGFSSSLILFDWVLVWGIEKKLGHAFASDFRAIALTSFAAITFLIAEVMFTGYYGHKSDRNGVKPILTFATFGAAIVLVTYAPAPLILISFQGWTAVTLMVLYLALIHFLHGIIASGKVSPSLGFINYNSTDHNRALRMGIYDNAILYGRAVGMPLGGLLWYWMAVDEHGISVEEQGRRIAKTFPFLGIILVIAGILIVVGINNTPKHDEVHPFSLKEDITLAAKVMLEEKRKPLLAPWLALAALIGSVSLWGPSIAFRSSEGEERSIIALIPIIVIILALALPAPYWGHLADTKGRKIVLNIGLLGLPLLGLGALIGFPFYKDNFSLSNPIFLFAITPGIMLISGLVPVLMGALGDTADKNVHDDGQVMSGYHFIIAMGEIIGILIGGLVIGVFALLHKTIGLFETEQSALISGFLLFEFVLLVIVVIGIIKIPEQPEETE